MPDLRHKKCVRNFLWITSALHDLWNTLHSNVRSNGRHAHSQQTFVPPSDDVGFNHNRHCVIPSLCHTILPPTVLSRMALPTVPQSHSPTNQTAQSEQTQKQVAGIYARHLFIALAKNLIAILHLDAIKESVGFWEIHRLTHCSPDSLRIHARIDRLRRADTS